jgi:glycosyltransferase involved in cell wall biosynthesis
MDQKLPYSISVFFPVYNDALSIGKLVDDVKGVLRRRFNDWEIILVNDGSADGSGQVVDELAASDPRVRAVHHDRNRGYGRVVRTAFAHCTKDLIFHTDGDGQFDPRELDLLLDHMDDADVVHGFKIRRSDHVVRRIEGRLYHAIVRMFFGVNLRDVDCEFRLFRRYVIEDITPLLCSGGVIGTEILAKVHERGYRVAQVPVHHYPRPHGRSQFFCPRHLGWAILELFILCFKRVVSNRDFAGRRSHREATSIDDHSLTPRKGSK